MYGVVGVVEEEEVLPGQLRVRLCLGVLEVQDLLVRLLGDPAVNLEVVGEDQSQPTQVLGARVVA